MEIDFDRCDHHLSHVSDSNEARRNHHVSPEEINSAVDSFAKIRWNRESGILLL